MKFITTLLIGILFIIHSCKAENNDLFGKWIIYKYVGGNVSALSEEDAKTYIDKEFEFQSNYAIINSVKFDNPKYDYREEQALDYLFYNYRISKDHIGLQGDLLKVLEVSASNQVPYELFVLKDKMIINIDGVFFFLTKKAIEDESITQSYTYSSKGSFRGKVELTGKERVVKISYSFFSYPDQLIVEDQQGNVLFKTSMTSTASINESVINLTNKANVSQLKLEVKNKDNSKTSRWRFSVVVE